MPKGSPIQDLTGFRQAALVFSNSGPMVLELKAWVGVLCH